YKQIFSHPKVIEDLLRGFIHEDWAEQLDYSTLEKVNGSYVSEDLKDRSDDVVWRVKPKEGDQWLYLYLLIEFQSRIDRWMALRIMVYVGLLYQDLIKSGVVGRKKGQLKKLPPVFPMVIYNGKGRWRAARDVFDLIQPVPGELSRYLPKQPYWLLDEVRMEEDTLPDGDNTVAEIIRLENSPDPEAMQRVIARLKQGLAAPEFATLRRALTVWIKRVLLKKQLTGDDEAPDINDLDEVNTMLEDRIEQWSRKLRREGWQEGRWEGMQQGIRQGQIKGEAAVLERQLAKRFGPLNEAIRQKLNTATLEQLEIWTDCILDATRIEDVFTTH
ncbi:MAG: Rpn family recombination-promoting nuclease/putative transposase, partial [Methylococcaceae bacterium]